MAAAPTTTTLPFFLISLLILFISCSHIIISCSAIATPTHEGQGRVPSSVTPKAAAVHYWHLMTRNNKPLPPIFLSKLSPLSPSKLIATNYGTTRTMSNGGTARNDMEKIDDASSTTLLPFYTHSSTHAPQDRHTTANDDMEKIDDASSTTLLPFYTYSSTHAPQDRHTTANDDMEKIDDASSTTHLFLYTHSSTHAPQDRHTTANDDMEKIDDASSTTLLPFYTHEPNDDMEKIDDASSTTLLPFYTHSSTHAPQDRHTTANADMEKIDDASSTTLLPFYTHSSTQDRHTTAASDDDAKKATKHSNFDSNNSIKMVTGDESKEKATEQNRSNSRGNIYFRESGLKEGKTIPSFKFLDMGSSQYFLPRSIASKIPFSDASAISKILHIPTDSAMYRAMETTISLCRMPPNAGETKQCVTSAEDMIDYAISTLGANTDIRVWSTHNLSGFGGKSLIGKVEMVFDGVVTAKNHVTCHKFTFPYMVYFCHNVFKTRIYDLEILDGETKAKINEGVVLCHLDTSAWSPDHASFVVLGSEPGKTEVCHWVAPYDMVWTAGHVE